MENDSLRAGPPATVRGIPPIAGACRPGLLPDPAPNGILQPHRDPWEPLNRGISWGHWKIPRKRGGRTGPKFATVKPYRAAQGCSVRQGKGKKRDGQRRDWRRRPCRHGQELGAKPRQPRIRRCGLQPDDVAKRVIGGRGGGAGYPAGGEPSRICRYALAAQENPPHGQGRRGHR